MGMAKTRKAVDQNERDSSGNSALHLAVTMGSLGLVQTLLSLAPKLNVNFQDFESGYTALHKVRLYWACGFSLTLV